MSYEGKLYQKETPTLQKTQLQRAVVLKLSLLLREILGSC